MTQHESRPIEATERLVAAMEQGDLEAAVDSYEPDGILVARPGQVVRGRDALRAALAGFIAVKPKFTTEAYRLIESGDTALYLSRWKMAGTDPSGQPISMGGESADVLRRQADGRWLIALDNPWGTALLS